jgi:cytochrome c553
MKAAWLKKAMGSNGWIVCLVFVAGMMAQGCGPDMFRIDNKEISAPPRTHSPEDAMMRKGGGGGWWAMSFEDRKDQMEKEVFPAMVSLFRLYDENKYNKNATLHCMSCHGLDSSETDFSKPSKLYPLDPNNLPTRNDKDPRIANAVRFMEDNVVPHMSRMLGSVVTCFSCHASTTGQDLKGIPLEMLKNRNNTIDPSFAP